jgi:hypothetical protein
MQSPPGFSRKNTKLNSFLISDRKNMQFPSGFPEKAQNLIVFQYLIGKICYSLLDFREKIDAYFHCAKVS